MSADSADSSHVLVPHPAAPATVSVRIGVSVAAAGGGRLVLHYCLEGDTNSVRWPAAGRGQRMDGLWRHTCFEAFLAAPSGEYLEYNFSPSGAWAAYQFSAYRAAMRPLPDANTPAMSGERSADAYNLKVTLDVGHGMAPPLAALRLGLAAVIEDESCGLSYWALAHPAEKPDFHHADSFTVCLAAVKEHE
jgi:hypothetical protein